MNPQEDLKETRLFERAKLKSYVTNKIKAEKWISLLSINIERAAEKGDRSIIFYKKQVRKVETCCFYWYINIYENVSSEVISVIMNRMKEEGFCVLRYVDDNLLISW